VILFLSLLRCMVCRRRCRGIQVLGHHSPLGIKSPCIMLILISLAYYCSNILPFIIYSIDCIYVLFYFYMVLFCSLIFLIQLEFNISPGKELKSDSSQNNQPCHGNFFNNLSFHGGACFCHWCLLILIFLPTVFTHFSLPTLVSQHIFLVF
jgi:hypothetical protein